MTTLIAPEKLIEELRARAEKLGFEAFGVTSAENVPDRAMRLTKALDQGWHGDMDWMLETANRRISPENLWTDAKSVIMLGVNYAPAKNPMALLGKKSKGNISVYARNRDYHDIIKGKLKELAGLLARRAGAGVKVFVDTAPVMEKPLAEASGLGWQGKHTVLVSRDFGSWMFLGTIFTDIELPIDQPHDETCGSCTKCLDICPTNAFVAPFQLDARKCLAYLNNEHKTQIPRPYRAPMGNRIYGCDDCLAVCPWNKFASVTQQTKLQARADLEEPGLADLLVLDDMGFRDLFAGSPIKRLGHARFMRNVLIAVGNSDDAALIPLVERLLTNPDPLIRGVAIWAYRCLAERHMVDEKRQMLLPQETDKEVAAEWVGDLTPDF